MKDLKKKRSSAFARSNPPERIHRNDPLSRHRLKGAQTERTQAVADATNLLATLDLRDVLLVNTIPRHDSWFRIEIPSLRFQIDSVGTASGGDEIGIFGGFIPEPPANEALDQLLRTYCEEKVVPVAPAPVVDYKKLLADIDEKLAKGEICSTTNS